MIIVLEGIDGSGKTTTSEMVAETLKAKTGLAVQSVHWYSFIPYPDELEALAFQGVKKLKTSQVLEPLANCLWHCADFAHRWEKQVIPALNRGEIVLFDRFMYSALTRDCVRGISQDYVQSVYAFAQQPDLVFYLDLPVQIALDRKIKLGKNSVAYYEAGKDIPGLSNLSINEAFLVFQERCREQYRKILPKKTIMMDATQPQQETVNKIVDTCYKLIQSHVAPKAPLKKGSGVKRLASFA